MNVDQDILSYNRLFAYFLSKSLEKLVFIASFWVL